jgi:hypothetical protein
VDSDSLPGNKSFEVIVRRKIPYITDNLLGLMGGFVLMIVITDLFFLPTRGSSLEMKTAFFIFVIPVVIKKLFMLGVIGTIITGILQSLARRHKNALLNFNPDGIQVTGNKVHISIPLTEIRWIEVIDPRSIGGVPKGKLRLEIMDRWERTVDIRLTDYSRVEELMDDLEKYKDINIKIYDFNFNDDFEDERENDPKA